MLYVYIFDTVVTRVSILQGFLIIDWSTPPPLGEAMREDGLDKMETCITQIQNAVTQYIVTRPVMELS